MMKKLLSNFLLAVALCFTLTACSNALSPDEAIIMLPEGTCSLMPGETFQISYTISPEGTPVEFISSDSETVTVDESGLVQAVKSGTATIAVSAGDYSKAYLNVTVSADVMASIPCVILSCEELEMISRTEYNMTATVRDGNEILTDCPLTWESSDESIVQVTGGAVTAVAPGEAVITASASVDGETATASCAVAVHDHYKIELDKQGVSTSVGGKFTLAASIYDGDGQLVRPEAGELEYITSDPKSIAVSGSTFEVINIGSPSIGVRYKGNVASIPVDIFGVTADFFSDSTKDFYGEVDDVTFCGVMYETSVYQPHLYFSEKGVEQIKAYAVKNGCHALRVHAYAILKNNFFVLNNEVWIGHEWQTHDIPLSQISTSYDFWSQSEGTTEVYMWFEFI